MKNEAGENKKGKEIKVMVEVSARHVHLSQSNLDALFGKGCQLAMLKKLSQHSDFAAEETITIENNGKRFENVRIVGPVREKGYAELSKTDARFLKIETKIKAEPDGKDGKITAIGPKGKAEIFAITKERHLHVSNEEAKKLGLKEKQLIRVKIHGERALIFENVIVRIHEKYKTAVHLDTDEGNAAGIDGVGEGELIL